MKNIFTQLLSNQKISYQDAKNVMYYLAEGKSNAAQMAALLTSFVMRGITLEELTGFRDALLELCIKPNIETQKAIDLCGTGGDSKNTFNISTLSAFVVAGAGYQVAKHGNYGVSSLSGSSNMLEYFGYQFTNQEDRLKKELYEIGICFMHAPLFHPAMKNVAPIRKELGVKTFFNMLGPMVNPLQPHFQMVGVFNLELARMYHYIYQQTQKSYMIVHSIDGYDEVSLTSATKIYANYQNAMLQPEDFGFEKIENEAIFGGNTLEETAKIFLNVLNNEGTNAQKNVVLANAALAIRCFEPQKSLLDCVEITKESLVSGKALEKFKKLTTTK